MLFVTVSAQKVSGQNVSGIGYNNHRKCFDIESSCKKKLLEMFEYDWIKSKLISYDFIHQIDQSRIHYLLNNLSMCLYIFKALSIYQDLISNNRYIYKK